MKALKQELKLLRFELWQCCDLTTGKPYTRQESKAKELEARIKALENVLIQYH